MGTMRWIYNLWDKFQEWRWQRTKHKWAAEFEAFLQWDDYDDMVDYWNELDGGEGTD
jgi:hypothetical protein